MNEIFRKIKELILFRLAKIDDDLWVFSSFGGHYSDSPKAISESLHKLHPEIKIVWLLASNNLKSIPDYAKAIDINSAEAKKYRGMAKVLIDNVYANNLEYLNKGKYISKLRVKTRVKLLAKKGQKVYTSWHGTPLKKMGRDQVNSDIVDVIANDVTMILDNKYTCDIMRHLTFEKIRIEMLGCARNDLLYSNNKNQVKKDLNFPLDKKIALFAPTFRGNGSKDYIFESGINQLQNINIDEFLDLLSKKFGGEWVLVCRFHYHVDGFIDWESLTQKYEGKVINGNIFEDMSQYLTCADLLLTDYSSSMFDFMLTKKPCFLFVPDLDTYINEDRGLYIPLDDLPFLYGEKYENVVSAIDRFDADIYNKKIEKLVKKMEFVIDSTSSDTIVEYIYNDVNSLI